MKPRNHHTGASARTIEICSTPEGATAREIAEKTGRSTLISGKTLQWLMLKRRLFRVEISPNGHNWRYFAREEDARAFRERLDAWLASRDAELQDAENERARLRVGAPWSGWVPDPLPPRSIFEWGGQPFALRTSARSHGDA